MQIYGLRCLELKRCEEQLNEMVREKILAKLNIDCQKYEESKEKYLQNSFNLSKFEYIEKENQENSVDLETLELKPLGITL